MPLSNELRKLVARLSAAAEEGRLVWQRDRTGFSLVFPRSSVRLWRYQDHDDEEGISIQLVNADGKSAAIDPVPVDDPDYKALDRIYELADRSESKLDEALADAIAEITKTGKIGKPSPNPSDDITW